MLLSILKFLIMPIISAILCVTFWLFLYSKNPQIVDFINHLFSTKYWLIGSWLFFAVIGIDYIITSSLNTIGYRNVGQKSAAQYSLNRK